MVFSFRYILLITLLVATGALCSPVQATMTPEQIIQLVEDNLNGKTAVMQITMIVHTKRTQRTMKMESFSVGNKKSFIRVDYPKKDKGITFLKVDNQMWQYVPRIEKIIKIPASMMMQSWMGSDFTNDDLVKESSISEDYHKKLLPEEALAYAVELLPLEDAAVVWGKIIMRISKEYFLPTTVEYFDEDGVLVRIMNYQEVKKYGDRYYPSRWLVVPQTEDKEGHQTVIEIDGVVFDKEISKNYFTKRALKRFSQ